MYRRFLPTTTAAVASSSFPGLLLACANREASHRLTGASLLALTLAAAPFQASAQTSGPAATPAQPAVPAAASPTDKAPPYGLSGTVGVGVVSLPTYEGSPERRTLGGPLLTLNYRTRDWGSVVLDTKGLAWQLVDRDSMRFSLLAGMDPGRKDSKPGSLDPTPGDARLAGMGRVRSSFEGGVSVGYGPVELSAHHAFGDRGSRGSRVQLGAQMPWAASDRLGFTLGSAATWANQRYMQAYFGVTPEQSAASGFAVYTPKSGLQKMELNLGAEYTLFPDLKLQAGLGFVHLAGDAKDSPLVRERKTDVIGQAGIAYAF